MTLSAKPRTVKVMDLSYCDESTSSNQTCKNFLRNFPQQTRSFWHIFEQSSYNSTSHYREWQHCEQGALKQFTNRKNSYFNQLKSIFTEIGRPNVITYLINQTINCADIPLLASYMYTNGELSYYPIRNCIAVTPLCIAITFAIAEQLFLIKMKEQRAKQSEYATANMTDINNDTYGQWYNICKLLLAYGARIDCIIEGPICTVETRRFVSSSSGSSSSIRRRNRNIVSVMKINEAFGNRESINFRSWAVLRLLYHKSCIDFSSYNNYFRINFIDNLNNTTSTGYGRKKRSGIDINTDSAHGNNINVEPLTSLEQKQNEEQVLKFVKNINQTDFNIALNCIRNLIFKFCTLPPNAIKENWLKLNDDESKKQIKKEKEKEKEKDYNTNDNIILDYSLVLPSLCVIEYTDDGDWNSNDVFVDDSSYSNQVNLAGQRKSKNKKNKKANIFESRFYYNNKRLNSNYKILNGLIGDSRILPRKSKLWQDFICYGGPIITFKEKRYKVATVDDVSIKNSSIKPGKGGSNKILISKNVSFIEFCRFLERKLTLKTSNNSNLTNKVAIITKLSTMIPSAILYVLIQVYRQMLTNITHLFGKYSCLVDDCSRIIAMYLFDDISYLLHATIYDRLRIESFKHAQSMVRHFCNDDCNWYWWSHLLKSEMFLESLYQYYKTQLQYQLNQGNCNTTENFKKSKYLSFTEQNINNDDNDDEAIDGKHKNRKTNKKKNKNKHKNKNKSKIKNNNKQYNKNSKIGKNGRLASGITASSESDSYPKKIILKDVLLSKFRAFMKINDYDFALIILQCIVENNLAKLPNYFEIEIDAETEQDSQSKDYNYNNLTFHKQHQIRNKQRELDSSVDEYYLLLHHCFNNNGSSYIGKIVDNLQDKLFYLYIILKCIPSNNLNDIEKHKNTPNAAASDSVSLLENNDNRKNEKNKKSKKSRHLKNDTTSTEVKTEITNEIDTDCMDNTIYVNPWATISKQINDYFDLYCKLAVTMQLEKQTQEQEQDEKIFDELEYKQKQDDSYNYTSHMVAIDSCLTVDEKNNDWRVIINNNNNGKSISDDSNITKLILSEFLRLGANVCRVKPLCNAVRFGNIKMVEFIFEKSSCNINGCNKGSKDTRLIDRLSHESGMTPLMIACENCDLKMIQLLLKYKANVGIFSKQKKNVFIYLIIGQRQGNNCFLTIDEYDKLALNCAKHIVKYCIDNKQDLSFVTAPDAGTINDNCFPTKRPRNALQYCYIHKLTQLGNYLLTCERFAKLESD